MPGLGRGQGRTRPRNKREVLEAAPEERAWNLAATGTAGSLEGPGASSESSTAKKDMAVRAVTKCDMRNRTECS